QLAAQHLAVGFREIGGASGFRGQHFGPLPERELARRFAHRAQHHVERVAVRAELALVYFGQPELERQALARAAGRLEQEAERWGFTPAVAGRGVALGEYLRGARPRLRYLE